MMDRYVFVVGGASERGPEALLLDGCQVIGIVSLAVAGTVCAAMNRTDKLLSDVDRVRRLHDVVVEQHKMLAQMIDNRERDQFTGKQSDDSKRALQLLEMAGKIANGAE